MDCVLNCVMKLLCFSWNDIEGDMVIVWRKNKVVVQNAPAKVLNAR